MGIVKLDEATRYKQIELVDDYGKLIFNDLQSELVKQLYEGWCNP